MMTMMKARRMDLKQTKVAIKESEGIIVNLGGDNSQKEKSGAQKKKKKKNKKNKKYYKNNSKIEQ